MCGILGMVAAPGRALEVGKADVVLMRDTMVQRGPDDAGLLLRGPVALAHRRLAIRDRAGGRQPWLSEDEQTALVYNGELYNDESLRSTLIDAGFRFRSRCDTEVVMAAYRHWGVDCVDHLRGMFAFAVYDFRQGSLFAVRDRFGIKPLFFSRVGGGLQIASAIGCLLANPRMEKQPNLAAISHYLTTFRLTLGSDTVYRGIHQLMPGETLQFQDGKATVRRYWDYPDQEDASLDFDDAVDELSDLLDDAVRDRLVSDVPVGLFLSGGVDSSTIACHVRRHHSASMLGQCGGGDMSDAPDFEFAARCADSNDFEYGEVRVSADQYQCDWQELIHHYRTPLATPSDVIIYNLARSMKQSVGVVLGGEGADEALCGYAVAHWSGCDYDLKRALEAGQWEFGNQAASEFVAGLRSQYGRDSFASLTDHYFALNSLIPTAAKKQLLQPWAWEQADNDELMWAHYAGVLDPAAPTGHSASQRYSRLLHRVNLESLLARLDAATMQASLEARVPYTDHLLVERMFQIPHRHKIAINANEPSPHLTSAALDQRGAIQSKRLLRRLAQRLMPDDLALRKKASFPTPVQSWLAGPWSRWAAERLQQSEFARAIFQPAAIGQLADQVAQAGMWMWPLLNICLWGDQEFGAASRHR